MINKLVKLMCGFLLLLCAACLFAQSLPGGVIEIIEGPNGTIILRPPEPTPTPTVTPALNLSLGRSVQNSIQFPVLNGIGASGTDTNNFNNWSVVEETNATVTVSVDTRSVVFARNVIDDASDARAYIEFQSGPIYDDDNDVSVCFRVTNFNDVATGTANVSLEVDAAYLVGTKTRTPASDGIYCTVLDVASDSSTTTIRLGIGVTDADTKTNGLTISEFSFSPSFDGRPNEYVEISARGTAPDGVGWNGTAYNYDKDVSYNLGTGLTSFASPASPDTGPSTNFVFMITDSFGGFISRGVHKETFFGQDYVGESSEYSMIMHSQAGRSLLDTNPNDSTFLDSMYAHALAIDDKDAAPGICAIAQGVNDFVVEASTSAEAYANFLDHAAWCRSNNMAVIAVTAGPYKNYGGNWSSLMESERDSYNDLIRAYVLANSDTWVVDYDLILDADRDDELDAAFDSDGLHPSDAGYSALGVQFDSVIGEIKSELTPVIAAEISPSRTQCASPCTVVFSAENTAHLFYDEHDVWRYIYYYWDFDTDETDTHGAIYDQVYTNVLGDSAYEIGGPMATKTFLCETGICTYNVGVRAQDIDGNYGDDFQTITVNSESAQWSAVNTICISGLLGSGEDWTAFDKACPAGAEKYNVFPSADAYDGKLILLKRGETFTQNILILNGQSNIKIASFGDDADSYPYVRGNVWAGEAGFDGQSNFPDSAVDVTDASIASQGWSSNITFEKIKMASFYFPDSFEHIGLHDVDMDLEGESIHGGNLWFDGGLRCKDFPSTVSCSNIPFPKGAYISKVRMVGSDLAETNEVALNVGGIGCSMVNYTGIVDSYFRKAGEHNLRIMGWYRLNIMRNFFAGEHYLVGKQKITTRPCAGGSGLDSSTWLSGRPATWDYDIEGRTRGDYDYGNGADTNNSGWYSHQSRYQVTQSNKIGDETATIAAASGPKVQTNVVEGFEDLVWDVYVARNEFRNEIGQNTQDINSLGTYLTCRDNTYSPESLGNCWPSTVDPQLNPLRNPTAFADPSAPEAL